MKGHTFAMKGEQIYFDNQHVNHEELWYAVAGKDAVPTAEEAGRLLAENLARFHLVERMRELLLEERDLFLPAWREDPFVEAALARCEERPSREKVEALAQVIGQPVSEVVELLRARGKHVTGSDVREEVKVDPPPVQEKKNRSKQFWWSEEAVSQLKEAFLASTEETVSAAAKSIAGAHGWPESKVKYKIYELELQRKKAEIEATPTTQAAPEIQEALKVQDDSGAQLISDLAPPSSLTLAVGNVVWDVRVDDRVQRWRLDYPYGSLPAKEGQTISYRGVEYVLQRVGTNTVKASPVQASALLQAV